MGAAEVSALLESRGMRYAGVLHTRGALETRGGGSAGGQSHDAMIAQGHPFLHV